MRKANFLLLMNCAYWALKEVYNNFQLFITNTEYRLAHNSQRCYLRAVLNDAFDPTLRRIYIDNFDALVKLYLWPDEYLRDVNIEADIFLWPDDSYGDSGVDFTVFIPVDIVTSEGDLARLRALLAKYKTPGKNYNIVRF